MSKGSIMELIERKTPNMVITKVNFVIIIQINILGIR